MKTWDSKGLAVAMACCLLLGAAKVNAVDEDDPAERQQEAAANRFEMAKDGCKRLQGPDRERCMDKAEADYIRKLDSIRQNAPPGVWGEGPDQEGRQGSPRKPHD